MVFGGRLARGKILAHENVDDVTVLGVNTDEGSVLATRPEHAQEGGVIDHDGALVGHEELETRDAFVYQPGDLSEGLVVEIGDCHMESVVDGHIAVGLVSPVLVGLCERFALRLDREIDDGRGPADCSGLGAGCEGLAGDRPAEWHLEVGVDVYSPGHHIRARGIDDLRALRRQIRAQRHDLSPVQQNVGPVLAFRADYGAVGDDRLHLRSSFLTARNAGLCAWGTPRLTGLGPLQSSTAQSAIRRPTRRIA